MSDALRVLVLAGGFGGARMAHGFSLLGDQVDLSVIVNTADDFELHGLSVSPDLDTVMYTLAGLANTETGWGVRGETWSAAAMLERYGEPTWFRLGDSDIATHVVRTARLGAGDGLTDVTRGLCSALGVSASILPMTDDTVRTRVRTDEGWLDFQDYFVRRRHADEVLELAFAGVETARPTREVLAAIRSAELVVVAPSNPFVSVGPILALAGVLEELHASAAPTVAVSPIIGNDAVRGPAGRMLSSLAGLYGAAGVAQLYDRRYPGLVDLFVVAEDDANAASEIERVAIRAAAAQIVIAAPEQRAALARDIIRLAGIAR